MGSRFFRAQNGQHWGYEQKSPHEDVGARSTEKDIGEERKYLGKEENKIREHYTAFKDKS